GGGGGQDAWDRLVQVSRTMQQTLPAGQFVLASDGMTRLAYPGLTIERYAYDDLERLKSVEVGSYNGGTTYTAGYPSTVTLPTGTGVADVGRNRLTKATYPAQAGLSRREVSFGYGTGGTLDDQLSRIAALTTNLGPPTTIGEFAWMGGGRRASTKLGGGAIVA